MRCVDVLLIEPVRLLAGGLKHLLLGSPYAVVEMAQRTNELLASSGRPLPELVLCGPGASLSTEAERAWIRKQRIEPHRRRFVVLADTANAGLVHRLASAGVDAVLSQDISSDVLQRSLDLVMLGQQLFPPPPSCSAVEALPGHQAELIPFPVPGGHGLLPSNRKQECRVVLSQREGQVLRCLVDGASNKEIARELEITETTVKAHVKGLLRKIRASNRTQAAIWALENNGRVLEASGQLTILTQPARLADAQASRA